MADDWNAPKRAKEAKEDKEWERTSSGTEGSDCGRRADRGRESGFGGWTG